MYSVKNYKLLKTECNSVVGVTHCTWLSTISKILIIVRDCYTPDEGSSFKILDNHTCTFTSLQHPVFKNLEQLIIFGREAMDSLRIHAFLAHGLR